MATSTMPDKARIVVVGGGLAGIEAALYARDRLEDEAGVTMISATKEFVYRPFLSYVPFGLKPETMRLDLAEITEANGIRLHIGRADRVRPREKLVHFGARSVSYDYLILATGAVAVREPVEGLGRAHRVWDESDMIRLRHALRLAISRAEDGGRVRIHFLIPQGCAWSGPIYEVAFMTSTWLRRQGVRGQFELRLTTAEKSFVESLGPSIHDVISAELAKRNIAAETGRVPVRVDAGHVAFEEGGNTAFDVLVSAAVHRGLGPQEGLRTDAGGFYKTRRATRQTLTSDEIYAVGDGSDYPVKQGFLGLLQADAAAEHIAARILGEAPRFAFEPASLWMMEELDETLLAHGTTGSATERVELDHMSPSRFGRVEAIGYLPQHSRFGEPLYAGLLWKGTEIGIHVLAQLREPASQMEGS